MASKTQNRSIRKTTVSVNPALAYLASLRSPRSRTAMESRLRAVARIVGSADVASVNWATLNAAHVVAIIAKVEGSTATQNLTLSALKGVARSAWRLQQISTDELARINDITAAKARREPAGRDVARDERAALLDACKADSSPAGARDAAMFALAMATGLRRAEIATLRMEDVVTNESSELTMRIVGKGDVERTIYVMNGALKALRRWMGIRGASAGAMFCVIGKGGRVQRDRHMSTTAMHKRFALRCQQADLSDIGLHDLRRTWIGDLLDAGADIVTVAALAGHSDVRTTQRYDRRPDAIRRAAQMKVSVPY